MFILPENFPITLNDIQDVLGATSLINASEIVNVNIGDPVPMSRFFGKGVTGEWFRNSATTYNFVVPNGVYSIAAVLVGGGGGGQGTPGCCSHGGGGGGGALAYGNNIPVTPGETLTVKVGSGGSGGAKPASLSNSVTNGSKGGDSYIMRGNEVLLKAEGGAPGATWSPSYGASPSGSYLSGGGDGGVGGGGSNSSGGGGGGGAGGYTGKGGFGAIGQNNVGGNGAGGGGGGGSQYFPGDYQSPGNWPYQGGAGGGVDVFGRGTNGAAGTPSSTAHLMNGRGGSGAPSSTSQGRPSIYGGGGAGAQRYNSPRAGFSGARGAARIIWGSNRFFPTNNVSLEDSHGVTI